MRLAWVAPAAGIALAGRVLPAFARVATVELWAAQPLALEGVASVRLGERELASGDYDAVFYDPDGGAIDALARREGGVLVAREEPAADLLAHAHGALALSPQQAAELRVRFLGPVLALAADDSAAGLAEFVDALARARPGRELLERIAAELGAMRADPSRGVYDALGQDFGRFLIL